MYLIGVNQSIVITQAWFLAADFILDEEEVNLSPFINLWATFLQSNFIDSAILAIASYSEHGLCVLIKHHNASIYQT